MERAEPIAAYGEANQDPNGMRPAPGGDGVVHLDLLLTQDES